MGRVPVLRRELEKGRMCHVLVFLSVFDLDQVLGVDGSLTLARSLGGC